MKYLRLNNITFLLRLFVHVDRKVAYMETKGGDLIEGTLSFWANWSLMFERDIYSFVMKCHLAMSVTKSTNLFIICLASQRLAIRCSFFN